MSAIGVTAPHTVRNDSGCSIGSLTYPGNGNFSDMMVHMQNVKQAQDELAGILIEFQKSEAWRKEEERMTYERNDRISHFLSQEPQMPSTVLPRLFVVLPTHAGYAAYKNNPTDPMGLRLFFLCECGRYDKDKEDPYAHKIHMADTTGYPVKDSNQFLTEFGPYVLTMMEMVQHSFKSCEMTVPDLMSMRIPDKNIFASVLTALGHEGNPISLIEAVLKCITDTHRNRKAAIGQIANTQVGEEMDGEQSEAGLTTITERLAIDLTSLRSHLGIGDEDTVGGQHLSGVHWRCSKGANLSRRKKDVKFLKDYILDECSGLFDDRLQMIDIKVPSMSASNKFFRKLEKIGYCPDLTLRFGWDATVKDITAISQSIKEAEVRDLTLDISSFRTPFFTTDRRSRLILDHAFGGLESLRVLGQHNIYQDIRDDFSSTETASIRKLAIDSVLPTDLSKKSHALDKIIKRCNSVINLSLKCAEVPKTFEYLAEKKDILQFLKTVCLSSPTSGFSVTARVLQGAILSMEVVASFSELNEADIMFLQNNKISKLRLGGLPSDPDQVEALVSFMTKSIQLTEIDLYCPPERYPAVLEFVQKESRSTFLKVIRLHCERSQGSRCRNDIIDLTVSQNGEHPQYTAIIKMGEDDPINNSKVELQSAFPSTIFKHYGQHIRVLHCDRRFTDDLAFLLLQSVQDGSSLVDLELNPTSLGPRGIESIETVIQKSADLKQLSFWFEDLHEDLIEEIDSRTQKEQDIDASPPEGMSENVPEKVPEELSETMLGKMSVKKFEEMSEDSTQALESEVNITEELGFEPVERPKNQFQKACDLLRGYSGRLNGLYLSGNKASTWISKLQEDSWTREQFPRLETFGVMCKSAQAIGADHVQWITEMISGPQSSSVAGSLLSPSHTLMPTESAVVPLREVWLERANLTFTGWETVVRALDLHTLQTVIFHKTNFDLDGLECLLQHMPKETLMMKLKYLYVHVAGVASPKDRKRLERLRSEIRAKIKVEDAEVYIVATTDDV
ncbi:hypothetical protein BG011_008961 [Mortierella polycephala]|uniref:RNI-like protein n=1 Tax=Mortierella polycephala TaxID=41804 RepID=A0A9P6QCP0_9FUNG|nr:hypothetical protein BG011_008961 [Mortierella polycephala]